MRNRQSSDDSKIASRSNSTFSRSTSTPLLPIPRFTSPPVLNPPAVVDVFDPHHLSEWSRLALLAMLVLLCVSGSLKTLSTQFATNQRASHTSGLILIWTNYVGQFLFGVVAKAVANWKVRRTSSGRRRRKEKDEEDDDRERRLQPEEIEMEGKPTTASIATVSIPSAPAPSSGRIGSSATTQSLLLFISALDVFGCVVCLVASVLIGSGLYQILYGALLVMIALLSQAILGYRQNARQWVCLIFVTSGLWATALVSKAPTLNLHSEANGASLSINATVITPSTTTVIPAGASPPPICTDLFPGLVCAHVSLRADAAGCFFFLSLFRSSFQGECGRVERHHRLVRPGVQHGVPSESVLHRATLGRVGIHADAPA